MKEIIPVEINDFDNGTYIARSEADCKDSIDTEIFHLVNEHKEVIHIGLTSGIPIFEDTPSSLQEK